MDTKIGKWIRRHIPAVVGVPVAGVIDTGGGLLLAGKGIVTAKPETTKKGLKDLGGGALSIVGLKEVVTEKWRKTPTGGIPLPDTLAAKVESANAPTHEQWVADSKNGMHGWHANSNAEISSTVGPVMAPIQFLGGIAHEVDPGAVRGEVAAQGKLNATIDAVGDITANTLGILTGLIVPPDIAGKVGRKAGNIVPGPGDPDPTGAGTGGYTGDPTAAWKNKSNNPNPSPAPSTGTSASSPAPSTGSSATASAP